MLRLQRTLVVVAFFSVMGLTAQKIHTIRGIITDGNNPMENVAITVEGTENRVFSDAEGSYAIEVEPGKILTYTYVGMKDYFIRVEEMTRFLNVIMIPEVTELEEVTVTNSNRKSQQELQMEYPINKRLIRTAFGILDADVLASNIRFLNEDQINPIGLCILDLLRARFGGVRVIGDCQTGGRIFLRGGVGSLTQSAGVVYDVDGMILTQAPVWIDINNIQRIAIIGGLANTVKYGSAGARGVIVINTKGMAPRWNQEYDMAKLRNNYETGPVLTQTEIERNQPQYIKALEQSPSFEAAVVVYEANKRKYSGSGYYFLDAYNHFANQRDQQAFADEILEKNQYLFQNNGNLLKALAYSYQSQNRYKEALEVYKELFMLRPEYGQSYMNLALAYKDIGDYQKAAGMYARYKYLVDENFLQESEYFAKIMQNDSDNLFVMHGRKIGVDVSKIKTDLYVNKTTRILVEWSDIEAEFELQFINPKGQYHTWKHTYVDNEDRLIDEKRKGYSIDEHIIDSSLPGVWKINAKYLGNKSLSPTYIKVTVYRNFGTKSQSREINVYKLLLKDVNQELFTLSTGISVALN